MPQEKSQTSPQSSSARKKIVVGTDHAGFGLKTNVVAYLQGQGWEVHDIGCYSTDSVDYPVISRTFAETMQAEQAEWGILLCGSGIGVSIAANRYAHLRAVLAHDETIAKLSRHHNNSNVLCMGGRVIAPELAYEIINAWLNTPFDAGRHERRIEQLTCRGEVCDTPAAAR